MKDNIRNATIESVSLGTSGHGLLSAWLYLKYSSCSGQGFGGYYLKGPSCAIFIERCLEVGGVEEWNHLVGKNIRVNLNNNDTIEGIGHIVEDDWFFPKEEFKNVN